MPKSSLVAIRISAWRTAKAVRFEPHGAAMGDCNPLKNIQLGPPHPGNDIDQINQMRTGAFAKLGEKGVPCSCVG
jgi:hypothetical protein